MNSARSPWIVCVAFAIQILCHGAHPHFDFGDAGQQRRAGQSLAFALFDRLKQADIALIDLHDFGDAVVVAEVASLAGLLLPDHPANRFLDALPISGKRRRRRAVADTGDGNCDPTGRADRRRYWPL